MYLGGISKPEHFCIRMEYTRQTRSFSQLGKGVGLDLTLVDQPKDTVINVQVRDEYRPV
jgi:hypothetical protein